MDHKSQLVNFILQKRIHKQSFNKSYYIKKAIVKVHILDVNDNYPLFPTYKLINLNYSSIESEEPIFETFEKVEENTKINTRITQLRAIDLDKQKNLTYKIVHSTDPTRSLAVEKFTGN